MTTSLLERPVADDIRVEIVNVTPALAGQWLESNTKNRVWRRERSKRYARDMLAGEWKMTAEPIKFDLDGVLSDGQHRLHAVVEAGVPVQMMVVHGVAPEAQRVMDSGRARTAGDQLGLLGMNYANEVAAIAAQYGGWLSGFYATSATVGAPRYTTTELLALVEANPKIIESAVPLGGIFRRVLPLPRTILGTIWMILNAVDPSDCEAFFNRIMNTEFSGSGDPLATLYRRVATDRAHGVRIENGAALYLFMRSWNAFRGAEKLSQLKIERSGVPFEMAYPV